MSPKKILIIDDDPDIQTTLKKRLEHHGFSCTCLSSVGAALQRLSEIDPKLVILDLGFRGANGTAFLQSAKNYLPPQSKVPPILVLSAYNEREVVDYVLGMGASGFIAKPFDAKVLISTVQDYLE